MALAAILGVILNLVLPGRPKEDEENRFIWRSRKVKRRSPFKKSPERLTRVLY